MQLKTTMFNSGDGGATVMTPTNLDESMEPRSRLSKSPEQHKQHSFQTPSKQQESPTKKTPKRAFDPLKALMSRHYISSTAVKKDPDEPHQVMLNGKALNFKSP